MKIKSRGYAKKPQRHLAPSGLSETTLRPASPTHSTPSPRPPQHHLPSHAGLWVALGSATGTHRRRSGAPLGLEWAAPLPLPQGVRPSPWLHS